jgi:hypothetical protein
MSNNAAECILCTGCYTDNNPALLLRCTHSFHESCVLIWAESRKPELEHPTCPNCGANILVELKGPPSLDVLFLLEYTNYRKGYLERLEDIDEALEDLYDSDSTRGPSPE